MTLMPELTPNLFFEPDPHTYRVIVTTYANGQWFVHAEATHGSHCLKIGQGMTMDQSQEAAEEEGRRRADQWIEHRRLRRELEKTRKNIVVGEV